MNKHGVIKFQAPFEKMKDYHFKPEVRLYKSIILQAIIDASNTSNSFFARKTELEAKSWLFGKSKYFYEVCNKAEIEPDHVIRTAKKVIRLNYSNSKAGMSPKQNKIQELKSTKNKQDRKTLCLSLKLVMV